MKIDVNIEEMKKDVAVRIEWAQGSRSGLNRKSTFIET
jgi:hypothetical protein